MYPDMSPSALLALAVVAETLSLLLFGRANTLWRSPGMLAYPQRFLLLRSALVLIWVMPGWPFWLPAAFLKATPSSSPN